MNEDQKLISVNQVFSEFKNKTNSIILDVRSSEEYANEHIEKSINIPLENIETKIKNIITNKNTTIYVFCRSGGRSATAQAILKNMGYKNTKNIIGGILKWKEQELPLK